MAAQAMPVLDQEQLLTRQVIRAYHFVMAKRMVARHRYNDWIFRDFHHLGIAKFVRNGHQQNVELSFSELVQQDPSRSLPHVQLELRQRSAQMRQQRGQDIRPDCRDYSEPQRPGQWLLRVAGQSDQFLGVDQQPLGAGRDRFPQGRQHHVAMAALKQRDAQPRLELLDPSAQRRLRNGTTFRSTAEMAMLGQSTQKAELLKTGQDDHRNFNEALRLYPLDPMARNGGPSAYRRYEPSDDLSMVGCINRSLANISPSGEAPPRFQEASMATMPASSSNAQFRVRADFLI